MSAAPGYAAKPLAALTQGLLDVPNSIQVNDVTLDSRAVTPGALFLACKGHKQHGLHFAPQAVAQGARAILFEVSDESDAVSRVQFGTEVFVAGLAELGRHASLIAARFFAQPAQSLAVNGVTGTNGKTTTAFILAQALNRCGRAAGYIGTIGVGTPARLQETRHTTADAVSLQRQLHELRSAGLQQVCMEVSSHALAQYRVEAVKFHAALFSNLTHDHLDYHGSMQAYGAAKARLFDFPGLDLRVINVDDAFGAQLAALKSPVRLIVVSKKISMVGAAEYVHVKKLQPLSDGFNIEIASSWGEAQFTSKLLGEFNVDNVLLVVAALLGQGIALRDAVQAVAACQAAPGRMEVVAGNSQRPLAIVDYAHTPDALAKALRAARQHCAAKLHVVFGCGGDRDATKRPKMGAIAAELADVITLTDDNPRHEDAAQIIAQIRSGFKSTQAVVRVEHSRAQAISTALHQAGPDDVVLVAGKGHEDYQLYGDERRPFSDQKMIRQVFGEAACSAR
jgi:UDP-N-acetylmuramoyl-L-alanyl-D-glutamate--2,6-diaminopimelate ligase